MPFEQADARRPVDTGGRGSGSASRSAWSRRWAAPIAVESREGAGSLFHVHRAYPSVERGDRGIRRRAADPHRAASAHRRPRSGDLCRDRSKRRRLGHGMPDVRDGVRRAGGGTSTRASHDRFTLALIDRTHPETDGERDAREELGRELKILTFSACDDDSAVRAGHHVLTLPVRRSALYDSIVTAIAGGAPTARRREIPQCRRVDRRDARPRIGPRTDSGWRKIRRRESTAGGPPSSASSIASMSTSSATVAMRSRPSRGVRMRSSSWTAKCRRWTATKP